VKNLSDSTQNHLSEEELLELSKISSDRSGIMARFFEQNLVFRCASIFLALSGVLVFIFLPFLFATEASPTDIVAQSYRGLLRVRLFIVIALAVGLIVSFYDRRIFKGFLFSLIIVISNYSIDMYYFYNEFLTQSDGVYQVLYYTRPALLFSLILMYINYNKS
tara:strand:+ start:1402 stop:1890 length:489 start_codon:yes stop_codon:yes gene_type:complete